MSDYVKVLLRNLHSEVAAYVGDGRDFDFRNLTARLETAIAALAAPGGGGVPDGFALVRADVVAFLNGEAELEGRWFGEDGPIIGKHRHQCWWRKHLQVDYPATPQEAAPDSLGDVIREMSAEFEQQFHPTPTDESGQGRDVEWDEGSPCMEPRPVGMVYPPKPAPRASGYLPDGSGVGWNAYDTAQMEAYARDAVALYYAKAHPPEPPACGDGELLEDVAEALANYSLSQKPSDPVGHRLTMNLRERFRAYRNAPPTVAEDAARLRYLRDVPCNHFHLTRNDEHAPNYMTAAEWIEESPQDFADTPPEEVERMKATNTIWCFQIYPDTPIGFYRFYGATPEAAIDAARLARGDKA